MSPNTSEPIAPPQTTGEAVQRYSPQLTGAQRRHLRGLGHHLKPLVRIGDRGIHAGLLAQVEQCLLDHELIKVRWKGASPPDRIEAARQIFTELGGMTVQIVGATLLVYRPHPEEPTIHLPKQSG
ncbi:MAG: ribosome assembly RNA-binding protein YhbY [Myxococcales bacterium]|nr:ribosome assembly RNA-binding protein YhbY [Myxococcales bacterium]